MSKVTKTDSKSKWRRPHPSQRLQAKLKQAAQGKCVAGVGVQVNFMVTGGVHGEHLFESIQIDTDGNVLYERKDQLRKQRGKKTVGQVDRALLKKVFADIQKCNLAGVRKQIQQIPPDMLVGSLTVRCGKYEITNFFPMDEIDFGVPKRRPTTKLKLHSGKVMTISPRIVPSRIIKAMDSLTEVPKLLEKPPRKGSK